VDTDYTVSGVGIEGGGDVTRLAGPLPTGSTWDIASDFSPVQLTDFPSQGAFFPEVHEDAFDKLTYLLQQISRDSSNAIRFPWTDSGAESLLPPQSNRVGKLIQFDNNGSAIVVNPADMFAGAPSDVAFLNSIATLRANTSSAFSFAQVFGYNAPADGGVGSFWRDATDVTSLDDGGLIIVDAAGNRWKRLYSGAIYLSWFGAMPGNSAAVNTPLIQAAINAMPDGSTLIYPGGDYLQSNIDVTSKSNIKIFGWGAKILLTGNSGAESAFKFYGTCDHVEIAGFACEGDGVVANKHRFIHSGSGQTLTNLHFHHNNIKNVVQGISLNTADSVGYLKNVWIHHNGIENVYGEVAGSGYGIHYSARNTNGPANIIVSNNTVINAQRHALYHGSGTGCLIVDNIVERHRDGLTADIKPAIKVRGNDVLVDGNIVNGCTTGFLIAQDTATDIIDNIKVTNNEFNDCRYWIGYVGYVSPEPASITNCVIDGNTGNSLDAGLVIWHAKKLSILDNNFSTTSDYCMQLRGEGEGALTATYTDDIKIEGNTFEAAVSAYRLTAAMCEAASKVEYIDNMEIDSGNSFSLVSPLDNPNIKVVGTRFNAYGSVSAGNFLLPDELNRPTLNTASAPTLATDTGTIGEIRWSSTFIYICTATDTWKRVAIATW
jgi:hypothetical protein